MKKSLIVFAILILVAFSGCGRDAASSDEEYQDSIIESTEIASSTKEPDESESEEKKYTLEASESSVEASEFFDEHSEVISTISFQDSQNTFAGSDILKLLRSRGFDQYDIVSEYDAEGNLEDVEITEETTQKYPLYYTYYITESGDLWTILVIDGKVTANPASYNMNSELAVQVVISESETIMSYDSETNTYYETIPDPETLIVKVVPEINAEVLEQLTFEGIDTL